LFFKSFSELKEFAFEPFVPPVERQILGTYLPKKLGGADFVNVFGILILFIMKHFQGQDSKHEELLLRITLCIIARRCHGHIWLINHQLLFKHH
jgi:hypothetical protein